MTKREAEDKLREIILQERGTAPSRCGRRSNTAALDAQRDVQWMCGCGTVALKESA